MNVHLEKFVIVERKDDDTCFYSHSFQFGGGSIVIAVAVVFGGYPRESYQLLLTGGGKKKHTKTSSSSVTTTAPPPKQILVAISFYCAVPTIRLHSMMRKVLVVIVFRKTISKMSELYVLRLLGTTLPTP
mmetsp:Transcript_26897/g.64182  ORF Transcript_26897/g.64182 Transcript_26897/m.64182 type:complete len:130 (+) Transcript_26897:3031-3420(+)